MVKSHLFELSFESRELNQGKFNNGNKYERRHIKLKFLNVCTKAESEFKKILNYSKYGIPRPIGGQKFKKKIKSFSVSNFLAVLVKVYIHQFARIKSEKITLIYGIKG